MIRFILFVSVVVVIYVMAKIIIKNLLSQRGDNSRVNSSRGRSGGRKRDDNIEDVSYTEIESKKNKKED
jgi:hypothetical protein